MFLIVLTSLKIGCSEVYRDDGPGGEVHRRTHRCEAGGCVNPHSLYEEYPQLSIA